jgi:hypothetical protein
MDFDKLLEPYTENGRTIAAQLKWLVRNGFPQSSIDYAISAVYKRLENGETFEMKRIAKIHYESDLEEQMKKRIGEVESNLDLEWNKLGRFRKTFEVWFRGA